MCEKLPPRISLIGFMGSGKSSIGRLLAAKVAYTFIDLDKLIEERTGKSIPEIFAREGEELFRDYEREALYSLSDTGKLIIAAGGGAAVQPANREFFLNQSYTIYLKVSFKEFLKRTRGRTNRPLLKKPPAVIEALYYDRLPLYRQIGREIVTDGRSLENITREIMTRAAREGSLNGSY